MARYKRTGFLLAGTGLVIGLAAVVLWPQLKRLFQNPAVKGRLPGTQVSNKIWDGQKWVHEDDYIDPDYVDSLPYNRMLRGL